MLRKVIGPKREELTGKLRTLHNEEFHDHVWETGLMKSAFVWEYFRKETPLKTRAWRAG